MMLAEVVFGRPDRYRRFIPAKIGGVESKDPLDAVGLHGGHVRSVVSRLAEYPMLHHDLSPNLMNARVIRLEGTELFTLPQLLVRFARSHSEPVVFPRPGGDHPEFSLYLRRDEQDFARSEKGVHRLASQGALRVLWKHEATENVRIEKNRQESQS